MAKKDKSEYISVPLPVDKKGEVDAEQAVKNLRDAVKQFIKKEDRKKKRRQ